MRTLSGSHCRTKWSAYAGKGLILLLFIVLLVYGYLPRGKPPESGTGIKNEQFLVKQEPLTLKVGVYNIYRGRGSDGKQNIGRTANVLGQIDLLSLHEVAGGIPFWSVNQARQLADMLAMAYLFRPVKTRFLLDASGNGLLTRLPIGRWQDEPLLQTHATFRRWLMVDLKWKNKIIKVLSTHLDNGQDRAAQLKTVLQLFRQHSPAILLGDLNTRRQDPVIRQFMKETGAVDTVYSVHSGAEVEQGVDWILTRGFNVLSGGVVPQGISDHPYYWVELEYDLSSETDK